MLHCVCFYNTSCADDLGPNDLRQVRSALFSVQHKWYNIGLELYFVFTTLDIIKSNFHTTDECLTEMLKQWLSRTSPGPSWSGLVEALSSEPVGEKRLASQIQSTYCTTQDNSGDTGTKGLSLTLIWNLHVKKYCVMPLISTCVSCMILAKAVQCHLSSYLLCADACATENNTSQCHLSSQIDELQNEFVKLRDDVYESVKAQPVGTFKVKLASVDVNAQKHHETALKSIIGHKETIEDIWIDLSFYMNFLNYELLQHVLNKFEVAALQKRMKQYKEKITAFFRSTKVCDFVEYWPVQGITPPKADLREFIVKYGKSWETCTLEQLDQLKGRLARKLLIPEFAVLLQNAQESSVSVIFSIPASIVALLQADIKSTELKVFVDMDIETITVDSVVCYEAPLLQYTTHLKQLYTSRNLLQPLTDSKPEHLLQFRLARIEKQTLSQGDMDRFTRESLRGDMDDVVYKKMAMELSELGVMPDSSQPEVVLIKGAPGVGKTTFAWDQCRQWAEGKLLQAYTIVLLLPLRDNNIRQITSLPSLFRHSNRQVRDEVTRTVTERNGKGCLIWLEGWDELVDDLRSDSLFTELVRGIQLPAATIYITSRPWATGGLLELMGERISQHTELLALAKEQVNFRKRGISEQLAATSTHTLTTDTEETAKPSDFLQYIESQPLIIAAMYTPVTAAIVEQVFKSAAHNPPTTVTQLYSAYVLMRLEQYLTEHPKYSDMKLKVRTLADLPEEVLADFQRLCGLAYEGVSQQMIVFSSLPESVSTLGLLQSVPQVYDEGEDQVSYNFLHYTVQEYLAALHLSHLQPQEQMTIIETKCLRMVKIEYGRSYCETIQFKTILQFLAGITNLEAYPVDFLSKLLSQDAATVYSWMYESQNLPLFTSVLGSGERELSLHYSATTTDYFVAGYCLAHSKCTWNIEFSVDDIAVEFLSKGCNHQLPETGISSKIVSASFIGGSITADGVEHFLTIPNSLLQHIQQLDLHDNKLDRRECDLLAEGVKRMPCLKALDLAWNSGIGSGGAVQLVSSLHSSKLRELHMSYTGISDPDFECLASYIHSTTSLQELSIGWNDISVESIASLCTALSANSSMRSLEIRGCRFTTSHCECLGQLLRRPIQCKIEELDLRNCNLTSDGVGELVSEMSDNHTLRVLNLSGNQIRSEGAVTIATMLKTNSSLQRLYLVRCSIDSSGGVELGTALERNKTLRELRLSQNALGNNGVRGLSVGLENNLSLEHLYLYGDKSLGEEEVSLLLMNKSRNLNVCLPKFERPKKPPFLYGAFEGIYMYMYINFMSSRTSGVYIYSVVWTSIPQLSTRFFLRVISIFPAWALHACMHCTCTHSIGFWLHSFDVSSSANAHCQV